MLANVLALAVALGSIALYLTAFIFPALHRKQDFIWSGVGLFYALVLWVCAGRITGAVLLGQTASVALLGWFAWQTLLLRSQATSTDDIASPIDKLVSWANDPGATGVQAQIKNVLGTGISFVQTLAAKVGTPADAGSNSSTAEGSSSFSNVLGDLQQKAVMLFALVKERVSPSETVEATPPPAAPKEIYVRKKFRETSPDQDKSPTADAEAKPTSTEEPETVPTEAEPTPATTLESEPVATEEAAPEPVPVEAVPEPTAEEPAPATDAAIADTETSAAEAVTPEPAPIDAPEPVATSTPTEVVVDTEPVPTEESTPEPAPTEATREEAAPAEVMAEAEPIPAVESTPEPAPTEATREEAAPELVEAPASTEVVVEAEPIPAEESAPEPTPTEAISEEAAPEPVEAPAEVVVEAEPVPTEESTAEPAPTENLADATPAKTTSTPEPAEADTEVASTPTEESAQEQLAGTEVEPTPTKVLTTDGTESASAEEPTSESAEAIAEAEPVPAEASNPESEPSDVMADGATLATSEPVGTVAEVAAMEETSPSAPTAVNETDTDPALDRQLLERCLKPTQTVINAANQAAAGFGSTIIRPQDLLVGFLRVENGNLKFSQVANINYERICQVIEANYNQGCEEGSVEVGEPKFSRSMREILETALTEAERKTSQPLQPAQLLLTLVQTVDPDVKGILEELQVNLDHLQEHLQAILAGSDS